MGPRKESRDEKATGSASTPKDFPETAPPTYPTNDHSFTLQGIFELQGTVSKLQGSFEHLEKAVADQSKDIRGVQKTIWIATGAFIVISGLLGLFGLRIWDAMVKVSDSVRHPPAPISAPAPTPHP